MGEITCTVAEAAALTLAIEGLVEGAAGAGLYNMATNNIEKGNYAEDNEKSSKYKNVSNNSKSNDNFKPLKSNKDANKFSKGKGYDDAHDLKRSHVGKGNESKFDIEVDNKTQNSRLISKDKKTIIPIE